MSLQIAKVVLGGNIVSSFKENNYSDGKHLVSFTIAVNKIYNGQRKTVYIYCQAWDSKADFIKQNFNKGMPIFILGQLQTIFPKKSDSPYGVLIVTVDEIHFSVDKSTALLESIEFGESNQTIDDECMF